MMRKIIYIILFLAFSGIVIAQIQTSGMKTMRGTDRGYPMQTNTMPDSMGNKYYPPIKYPQKDSTQIAIPTFTVTKMNGQSVTASDINVSFNYDLKTNVDNMANFALSIKNITTKNFATPFNGSINVTFSMKNFNLDVVREILVMTQKFDNKNLTEAQKDLIFSQILTVLPRVVTKTTAMTLDKVFTNDQGSMSLNFALSYPSNMPLPTTSESLYNNLKFSLNLKITTGLLDSYFNEATNPNVAPGQPGPQQMGNLTPEQQQMLQLRMMMIGMAKQTLATWVAQGYVTKTNTDYVVTILHENGVYTINGKVIDLSPYTQGMMPTGGGAGPTMALPVRTLETPRTPPSPTQDVNISPTELTPVQIGTEPNNTTNGR